MQTTHFIKYLSSPDTINLMPEQDAASLIKEFPYCQSGQILLALQLHSSNHLLFEQQLKKSAIYSSDRKRLYELLNQSTLQKEQKTELEQVVDVEELMVEEKPITKVEEQPIVEPIAAINIEEKETKIPDLELEYLNQVIASAYTYELEDLEKLEEGRPKTEERSGKSEVGSQKSEEEPVDENTELTFTDWLKKVQKGGLTSVTEEKPEKQHKFDLIDKFIQEDPKIKPKKTEFYSPINMARLSVVDDSELVSETLALIQVEQGNYQEAIKTYQKLSLKNPEKRTYFANQIKILNQKIK
jgi:tetratricopeptide (TPR) repeat protein